MSFASFRLPAGALAAGPLLFLMMGCSGGTPAEGTPQAGATPAAAAAPAAVAAQAVNARPASSAARTATPAYDRYANPAPTTPAAKPAVDFDGEAFKSAVANQAVVGDRYSR
jgi:hypothetical protein